MKFMVMMAAFLSLSSAVTLAGGSEVRGGDIGVCDPEKEIVLQQFKTEDLALGSLIDGLLARQYKQSCTVGSFQLIKPDARGNEDNHFNVYFSQDGVTYAIVLSYTAHRANIPADYQGHAPGRYMPNGQPDETVLENAKLFTFSVSKSVERSNELHF